MVPKIIVIWKLDFVAKTQILYTKIHICAILYKSCSIKQITNTQPIWKRRYPTGFLKDIIDNIITFRSYYVIRTLANGSAVYWSHDFRTPEILRFILYSLFRFHFSFTVSLMIEFYLFRLFSLKYIMIPKKYVRIKLYLLLIWANAKPKTK